MAQSKPARFGSRCELREHGPTSVGPNGPACIRPQSVRLSFYLGTSKGQGPGTERLGSTDTDTESRIGRGVRHALRLELVSGRDLRWRADGHMAALHRRLIVDVLGIGVSIGSMKFTYFAAEMPVIESAQTENAIRKAIGRGEKAAEMRRRVTKLGETAKKAMEPGGSSYVDLTNLIPDLRILPFPSPALTGLPPGIENIAELSDSDSVNRFMVAVPGLREPFSRLLREIRPVDAVVSDYFFPWTIPVAEELGIPRLVFHGTGFFALCATAAPATPLGSSDTVVLGGLPRRVVMLRSQMPDSGKSPPAFRELFGEIATTEGRSFGTVVNSFYELEPDYIRHFREAMGHRAWHVGPIALFGRDGTLLQRRLRPKEKQEDEEAQERKEQTHEPTGSSSYLIEWLDRNRPGSVIYVCFGSMGRLGAAQLAQLAFGLEASGCPFIWVVRDSDDDDAEWLPRGFKERVEDRGLILKGWAPQTLILGHPSVGGFVTHCGWNSCLEGVVAGVPMVTWPLYAEQFFNERLIVDALRIGVPVGATKYALLPAERPVIEGAQIETAVRKAMGGGEEAAAAAEMRNHARDLAEAAKRAMEPGGSVDGQEVGTRRPLHVVFFPFMAMGHMPPMVDMANLFAARGGVAATMVTTPANVPLVNSRRLPGANISLRILPFPSPALTGLPPAFTAAVPRLREPFSRLLCEIRPVDAVVSDYFFPWTIPVAEELGIPRLVFHGTSFFSLCAIAAPATPLDGGDIVVLNGLPRRVVMLRSQMQDAGKLLPAFRELLGEITATEGRSYGAVVNNYELEPDYVRHFRETMGHRAWHVGPIALFGRDGALLQKRLRPKEKQKEENEAQERKEQAHEPTGSSSYLLEWLDQNQPGSVLYVCFGSMGRLEAAQLAQLAFGLEASDYPFIWVVRDSDDDDAEWLRRGFRERGPSTEGVVPATLILAHPSVEGFVTHCGWNSCLEGVVAGVPMVAWPLYAKQFFNERLIVDALRIGVSVRATEFALLSSERPVIEGAQIETVVRKAIGGGLGEEAAETRRRARELGEAAKRAMEPGGSSYVDLANLIQELMDRRLSAAVPRLREPFSRLLHEIRPIDVVVSDFFCPWTIPVAEELSILRLVFDGTGFFSLCAIAAHATPLGGGDTVVLGGLPHRVVMLRSQIEDSGKLPPAFQELLGEIVAMDGRSYGTVVNSFYELEPDYVRHFREAMGHRAWHVGPIALFGRGGALLQQRLHLKEKQKDEEEAQERKEQAHEPTGSSSYLLEWLDRNPPGSVLYVCLGSMGRLGATQLAQLAFSLEASGCPFIWVVRDSDDDDAECLPRGFKKRVEDRGLVLKGGPRKH
ncbi:UDP-glycosyltransferase 73B5 [Ananas comosus]|uniref:UDP-glycosyltransferase 73B5 n=1 Tax=Ananas comosus TaxID=4615 RepID=A0A199UY22_ANACO|nr:UDP-glycosyltransferase 73B5 [Ananas comosus]